MKRFYLLILAVALFLAAACNKEKEKAEAFLGIDTNAVQLVAEGGSAGIAISSNTDWIISGAVSSSSWLSVNPSSGTGNALVTIDATANPDTETRGCTLTVRTIDGAFQYQVAVQQAGSVEKILVSPTIITLESGSGNYSSFTVDANTRWSLSCDVDWLSFDAIEGQPGKTVVKVSSRTQNFSDQQRSAAVTIKGAGGGIQTITINQESLFAKNCDVHIANDVIMFDGIAGDITFGSAVMGYVEAYVSKSVATTLTEREIYEWVLENGSRYDTSYDYFLSGKLSENTEYVYCAIGYNKESYTGPMLMYSFRTKQKTPAFDAALDVYRQSNKWYYSTVKQQRCHHYYRFLFIEEDADAVQSWWSKYTHAFVAYAWVKGWVEEEKDNYFINDVTKYLSDSSAYSFGAITWGVSDTDIFSSEICHDYMSLSSSPSENISVEKRPTREMIQSVFSRCKTIDYIE